MTTSTEKLIDTARLSDTVAWLTPSEVAAVFRVDVKTVTRWAQSGRLSSIRTLGGHRRYDEREVARLMGATARPRAVPAQAHAC